MYVFFFSIANRFIFFVVVVSLFILPGCSISLNDVNTYDDAGVVLDYGEDIVVYEKHLLLDTTPSVNSVYYNKLKFDFESTEILYAGNNYESLYRFGVEIDYVKTLNIDLRKAGYIPFKSIDAKYDLSVNVGSHSIDYECDTIRVISDVEYKIVDSKNETLFKKKYRYLKESENNTCLFVPEVNNISQAIRENNKKFIQDLSKITDLTVLVEQEKGELEHGNRDGGHFPYLEKIYSGVGLQNKGYSLLIGGELFVFRKLSISFSYVHTNYNYKYRNEFNSSGWFRDKVVTSENIFLNYYNLGLRTYFNNCQKGLFLEAGMSFSNNINFGGYFSLGYHYRLTRYIGIQPYLFCNYLDFNHWVMRYNDHTYAYTLVDTNFREVLVGGMITLTVYLF